MPASYDFAYDVQDSAVSLDFGHNEKRKDDRVSGSYHVLLPDGRMQLVEYEAGSEGYKPQVSLESPKYSDRAAILRETDLFWQITIPKGSSFGFQSF